ncbi:MAG: hypothetical protein F6K56_44660 [Moorea sp. SIO3G5]|nr:hypothetical protein [Moorena sp. SIO3G5]
MRLAVSHATRCSARAATRLTFGHATRTLFLTKSGKLGQVVLTTDNYFGLR